MAGTHSVDAKFLHQAHILAHLVGGYVMTAVDTVLMTVHATYLYRPAVDTQQAITYIYVPETYPLADALRLVAGSIAKAHGEVIEYRRAVAPQHHIGYGCRKAGEPVARLQHLPALGLNTLSLHLPLHTAPLHLTANVHYHFEASGAPVAGIHVGNNLEVRDICPRHAVELHVACDAAHAPHVLALQIAAVRPAHHLHSHRISSIRKIPCDVPLRWRLRVLAVTNLAAVDIKVHSPTRSTYLGNRAAITPACRQREVAHVDTRGVIVARCPRRVAAEFITHVDIYRYSVSLKLYVARHHDAVPPRGRECGLLRSVKDAERPRPVEAHGPWPVRDDTVVWLHLVKPVHLQIVPIGLRLYARDAEKRHYYANGENVLAHIWVQRYEKKEIAEPKRFRYHTN